MKKVLVIGSAVVDVVIPVDHLPRRAEDENVYFQKMSLGGCAYNVSDCLRHFQVPYIPFFPVGSGVYGDFVRTCLREKGVFSACPSPSEENGCCYCLVEPDGERTFLCYHGAEYRFRPEWFEELDRQTAADKDGGIGSVYICGLEIEEPTGWAIIEYLEKHPEYTVYFGPSSRICDIDPEKMRRIFRLQPVLHLNREEAVRYAAKLRKEEGRGETAEAGIGGETAETGIGGETAEAGIGDPADAGRLLAGYTGNLVLITLGSDGCLIVQPNSSGETESLSMPAWPVREGSSGDAIGAGDSHIGTFIAMRQLGYSVEQAVRAAGRVAAMVVQTEGALLPDDVFQDLRRQMKL